MSVIETRQPRFWSSRSFPVRALKWRSKPSRRRLTSPSPASSLSPRRHLPFFFCRRLGNFMRGVDEKPHDGTERAVLQGDDADLHAIKWKLDGQDFDLLAPSRKPQCESGEDREVVPPSSAGWSAPRWEGRIRPGATPKSAAVGQTLHICTRLRSLGLNC